MKNITRDHWPVAVALAALVAVGLALRRRRHHGELAPRPRARPRVRSPIAEVYDEVARALARSGVPREAAVTPRELALRMAARGDAAAGEVGELTELYYAAEWGHRRDPAAEQRAVALADEIRATLQAARRADMRPARAFKYLVRETALSAHNSVSAREVCSAQGCVRDVLHSLIPDCRRKLQVPGDGSFRGAKLRSLLDLHAHF